MITLRLVVLLIFAAGALAVHPSFAEDISAARTLRVGTIISMNDLNVASTDDPAVQALLGMEVRRPLYIGQKVAQADLGPPTLVKRNDLVSIIYQNNRLGLRTVGRALGAGGEGEWIDVINSQTKLKIRGKVAGRGQVEVTR